MAFISRKMALQSYVDFGGVGEGALRPVEAASKPLRERERDRRRMRTISFAVMLVCSGMMMSSVGAEPAYCREHTATGQEVEDCVGVWGPGPTCVGERTRVYSENSEESYGETYMEVCADEVPYATYCDGQRGGAEPGSGEARHASENCVGVREHCIGAWSRQGTITNDGSGNRVVWDENSETFMGIRTEDQECPP